MTGESMGHVVHNCCVPRRSAIIPVELVPDRFLIISSNYGNKNSAKHKYFYNNILIDSLGIEIIRNRLGTNSTGIMALRLHNIVELIMLTNLIGLILNIV